MYGTDNYYKLINFLKKKDFAFVDFASVDNSSRPSVVFRHDIDFSIEDALSIANFEALQNIKATYFFMLTSNMYNPLSFKNKNLITQIKNKGHSISLHFDPDCYENIDDGFSREKQIFEDNFQVQVEFVSLHRPGKFLENNNRILKGCEHTYQDKYFKKMIYISDSSGANIFEKLDKIDFTNINKNIQVLTHPIWWTSVSKSPTKTLNNWINNNQKIIISETKKNCKTFLGN